MKMQIYNPKGIYNVDCYIITNGSIETFDNEHTTYTTMKIGNYR